MFGLDIGEIPYLVRRMMVVMGSIGMTLRSARLGGEEASEMVYVAGSTGKRRERNMCDLGLGNLKEEVLGLGVPALQTFDWEQRVLI